MISDVYLKIARDAIQARFDGSAMNLSALKEDYPELASLQATFVTLTLHGNLRGCIGSLVAHRPLLEDLVQNAQSAAFHDPRFAPLSYSEFLETKIEISLLSEPSKIAYVDKSDLMNRVRIGVDGVILRLGNHQATFLPQVWKELNDFETFFTHLGLKAGIGYDPLSFHPEIFTYQVEKIKEK